MIGLLLSMAAPIISLESAKPEVCATSALASTSPSLKNRLETGKLMAGSAKVGRKVILRKSRGTDQPHPRLAVRDPWIFEFLGIKSKEVMSETDLECSLLDKLERCQQ